MASPRASAVVFAFMASLIASCACVLVDPSAAEDFAVLLLDFFFFFFFLEVEEEVEVSEAPPRKASISERVLVLVLVLLVAAGLLGRTRAVGPTKPFEWTESKDVLHTKAPTAKNLLVATLVDFMILCVRKQTIGCGCSSCSCVCLFTICSSLLG